MPGEISESPWATTRMAVTRSSGSVSLTRKPLVLSGGASFEEVFVEPERGEDEDPHRAEVGIGGDLACRFEPVEAGHADVHPYDIGAEGLREGDGLFAVGGFADDVEVVAGVEKSPEPAAHQGLVVGECHPDHARASRGSRAATRKPPAGRGAASRSPPSAVARSRIPSIPVPWPALIAPLMAAIVARLGHPEIDDLDQDGIGLVADPDRHGSSGSVAGARSHPGMRVLT